MAKRNPSRQTGRHPPPSRHHDPADDRRRRPSFTTLVLFWPLLLWHRAIRNLPFLIRWPLRLAGDAALLAAMAALLAAALYSWRARHFDLAKVAEMPERSVILDRSGRELARIHGEKRDVIPLELVAQPFRHAILAREDERFYRHHGVDWFGVARACLRNIRDRSVIQGASTITMQLARNSFQLHWQPLAWSPLLQELDRKALEVALAYRIEAAFPKDKILEHYVNRIFWGHSIMGIEEASRTYFEKHAADLSLSESALLAGIVRGPNAFSPFTDAGKARRERDTTLDRMVTAGFLTDQQAAAAKDDAITVRPEWRRVFHDSYALDAVRRDLELILQQENIELGGLTIRTTIDSRIQQAAEAALDRRLREVERSPGYSHQTRAAWRGLPDGRRDRPAYLQGAAVVLENHSGAVLAVVGGRDADESKFNRALQARRQIGSIFKPFVYLAAFDEGLRPDTLISDDPIRPGEIKGAPRNWSPKNSDHTWLGLKPASYGLVRSRNTMSVRVGNYAGFDRLRRVARDAGYDVVPPATPASYLGAWEATPWDVASAYTIFPCGGARYRPFLIAEILDRNGQRLYWTDHLAYRAAAAGAAWSVSQVLQQVTTTGTAAAVKALGFHKPCAGKTGTTNDFKDAWFAGYTSALTCAVWVGLDQPRRTITGGYGATLALPVWAEVMKTADRLGYPAREFSPQVDFVTCELCRLSGKRATTGCRDAGSAYVDRAPADIAPPANDLCPAHPARALPLGQADPPHSPPPPRATPVQPDPPRASPPPPRATPVQPNPPRAQPVQPDPPRAQPVEPDPPRAQPVDPRPPLRALPVE